MTVEVERAGAVAACRAARAVQPAWAAREPAARGDVLGSAARRLAEGAGWLAAAVAVATGRPRAEVWAAEVTPTLDALRWLAREGAPALRPAMLGRSGLQWYFAATRHELHLDPHGVIGLVAPRNGLLFLTVPTLGAALLAGNAVVWKPGDGGAAVAFAVTGLLHRAGVPPGLVQVVAGGAGAARAVVEAGVDKLVFTGRPSAGRALYGLQAARGRPAVLELAGRHVAIVLAGAPLSMAATALAWAKLQNDGRNCVSVQLVLVERGVAPALVVALREALARAASAAPPAPGVPADASRLAALLADAVAGGATVVLGGQPPGVTLLTGIRPGLRVVEDEVLGPVLAVGEVDSAAQAVGWINAMDDRLSASVWAGDIGRARAVAARLDVGQVWINEQLHPTAQPAVTLAGRGASGFGATRGLAGLMEMVQPRVVSETPLWAPRPAYRGASQAAERLFAETIRLHSATGLGERTRALVGLARALVRAGRPVRP